jgi:hypothetical protein
MLSRCILDAGRAVNSDSPMHRQDREHPKAEPRSASSHSVQGGLRGARRFWPTAGRSEMTANRFLIAAIATLAFTGAAHTGDR